jgi:hypothetical protein
VHPLFRLRFDFPYGEARVLPVRIESGGGGIRLFEGKWNRGRRDGCTIQNGTKVIYVRTLFMFTRTRHNIQSQFSPYFLEIKICLN